MYRVAVVQNQSESLRAGYADVTQNFGTQLRLNGYEFTPFDGSNIASLFEPASQQYLAAYDAIFVSTNATSDAKTRAVLERNVSRVDEFLRAGKGLYLGYQKKMAQQSGQEPSPSALLPDPYRVTMRDRLEAEPDSSVGKISFAPRSPHSVGSFLLLNSPNEVTEDLIMSHCRENDFKAHMYRSILVPASEAAFDTVLEDRSYNDPARRLMLVNRSSLAGERVVVSTIAIDWESHQRLLENVITYITEGVPRVALIAQPQGGDLDFDFIRSTAKLLRVTNRQYQSLKAVPEEFARIHDVYVVSAKWAPESVEEFWRTVSGPKPRAVQPAALFRRLYHLGDRSRGWTSLTRFVNYTSIDVIVNDALLWIEQKFDGGFWADGFWNSHDILQMMDALDLDAKSYLPGVLRDIEPHLRPGGYDAVMGPSCGLLGLLNRLSIRYEAELKTGGFPIERRVDVATWVLENLEGQSDSARQVAARALFGKGGDSVLDALRAHGRGSDIDSLQSNVRKGLDFPVARVSSMSDMDLVRVVQLTHNTSALESVLTASLVELKLRQDDSGLWSSVGRTANILTNILEIEVAPPSMAHDSEWDEAVFRAVEALRGNFSHEWNSWGGIIQDTAMSVHALGMYRSRYDVESQELFETIEADVRSSRRSASVGRARIDLSELFARELEREGDLRARTREIESSRRQVLTDSKALARAQRKATVFQIFGGASFLLLAALFVSFLLMQREALKEVLSGTGSLLGLVIAAMITVPIVLLLTPRKREKEKLTLPDNREHDD
jgi:hypothetical protein